MLHRHGEGTNSPTTISFGHGRGPNFRGTGLAEHALTMKSLGDAIVVRNRVDALNVADNQADDEDRKTLTVVVAGGGFAVRNGGRFERPVFSTVKY